MSFISTVKPPRSREKAAWWFLFNQNRLLVQESSRGADLPFVQELSELGLTAVRQHYLGTLNGVHCYSAELQADQVLPEKMKFEGLRELFERLSPEFYTLAGHASQIVTWDQNHQYCGRCGTRTEIMDDERARICPQCRHMSFPRISPCIIVAVIKDKEILLARSPHFPPGRYSVLAGFVEAGETLEDCVKREVIEEVGITVTNIRYFDNQPWPFPHSLMIGFIADYAEGEISIDHKEIVDANWYSRDKLPNLPHRASIARRLVEWYLENIQ
ncbi:MAG: NAD(+) diphosphatase [SAR324 cluster bacterium]|nr:NAD(+) diphosphatase [SAR324 cluster bacterium]